MPFFSIIIPVYNCAATLQATINSLLNQTFKDFEVVFVDGVSKDNTLQIINDLRLSDNTFYINTISEPDKGIYDAMNKGIRSSKGEWLYFMGGDDTLYDANVLESIYKEIQKEPADLVYGNVTGEISLIHYVYDTVSKVLSKGIHHQSAFYKRPVFDVTGKYDLFFDVAADYHLTLKIFCDENLKTRYIHTEVANYGEKGWSSTTFDYTFFSCHYKFLLQHNGVSKLEKPEEVLNTSMYCSFCLLKEKRNMVFAWKNLLYYATGNTHLSPLIRLKTIFRALYWTLKPAQKDPAAVK